MKRALVLVALAILVMTGAFLVGGRPALIGSTLAIFTGTVGSFGSWGIIQAIGRLAQYDAKPGFASGFVIFAAFVKFPILVGAFFFAKRLGISAERGFIGSLLLVYSALVGWAATRNVSEP